MKLKKFNNFINEDIDNIDLLKAEFKKEFSSLFDIPEGEEENEPTNTEYIEYAGELIDKYIAKGMTIEDIDEILEEEKNDYDYKTYLGIAINDYKEYNNPGDYRKSGFYKVRKDGESMIAKYNSSDKSWYIPGSESVFVDSNFERIDEYPISF